MPLKSPYQDVDCEFTILERCSDSVYWHGKYVRCCLDEEHLSPKHIGVAHTDEDLTLMWRHRNPEATA